MLRRLADSLINLIYPKACIVCKDKLSGNGSLDNIICAKCLRGIKRNVPPFCSCCGRRLNKDGITKNICPQCQRAKFHFDRAFSPYVYDGTIKELIHEFKYKSKDYLGKTLGSFMVNFTKEYHIPIRDMDYIIPIPLHKAKYREREFNQAKVLSDYLSKEFNKETLDNNLIRTRTRKAQAELDAAERFLNIKDCFQLKAPEKIKNKNILLVDDVFTTGATSSEAACILKKSGANIVFVLTLAN